MQMRASATKRTYFTQRNNGPTEVDRMNSDKIKGTIDDAAGRVKRQVGEWTGDTKSQVEGSAQQVKGKVEKGVGNLRDAVRDTVNDAGKNRDIDDDDRDRSNRDRESNLDVEDDDEAVRERENFHDRE